MDLDSIQQRNAKVEADKAWETSWTRRILIAIMTYIIVSIYQICLGMHEFYLHAFVPSIGYLLSTLSLPHLKRWWLKKFYKAV